MTNELVEKQDINKLDQMVKKDGLYDALEQSDKIILLDFSGSMDSMFDDKELFRHLIDAVKGYEGEYTMIKFNDGAKIIECLENEKTGGSTNLTDALKLAYSQKAAEYIVVSDGLPDSKAESLAYALDNKMIINTIFMGDNPVGIEFMKTLANMTGGKSSDIKLLAGFGKMLEKTIKGLIEG